MSWIVGAGVRPVVALSEAARYNIGLAIIVVAMLVLGVWIYREYREVHDDAAPASPEELLAAFDEARSRGELDEEEYQRVRRQFDRSRPQPPGAVKPEGKKKRPD